MSAPFTTWTVLPHGDLTEVDDGILTVVGRIPMPMGEVPRRMTVVRLAGERLAIFSAIALAEDQMARIEAYGRPAFLVVPSAFHRKDARPWKDRYPGLTVLAPEGGRARVEEVVPVDDVTAHFDDVTVNLVEVEGSEAQEFALEISRVSGVTLVVNDLIANVHGETGVAGFMLKIMQFTGDPPHIPRPIKHKLVRDRAALASQLEDWAGLPHLQRILPAHGDVIADDAAGVLRRLAGTLR